jgi:hypothetical protein
MSSRHVRRLFRFGRSTRFVTASRGISHRSAHAYASSSVISQLSRVGGGSQNCGLPSSPTHRSR